MKAHLLKPVLKPIAKSMLIALSTSTFLSTQVFAQQAEVTFGIDNLLDKQPRSLNQVAIFSAR
jgi:hypothetical protein